VEKKNSYQLFMEEAPEAASAFNGLIGSLQNSGLGSKTMQLVYIPESRIISTQNGIMSKTCA
jgi:hypothetical protein